MTGEFILGFLVGASLTNTLWVLLGVRCGKERTDV